MVADFFKSTQFNIDVKVAPRFKICISGIVLCNDKEALIHALHASGSYIAYSENRVGMLYTPEMSRRAKAVELITLCSFILLPFTAEGGRKFVRSQ
jgi:hypothetical protein